MGNILLLNLIVLLYLIVIGYLGYLGYRGTKNAEDYLVAGRQIHPYVMALSYGATFISTSAIVGFGGISALYGMGLLWLAFLNIVVGIFIAFVVYGKATRRLGARLGAQTFPELLGKRYNSRFIQGVVGLVIFLAMPLYAGVVLIGGARFLQEALRIDYNVALLVFSVIIALYVVLGGLKGVMYTDALQGSIMLLGMIVLLLVTYIKLGGVIDAHRALTDMADKVPSALVAQGHRGWTAMPEFGSQWWWVLVSSLILGVGIGVLAQPQLAVRFMTVKSNVELNRAVLIGAVFIMLTVGVVYIVGPLTNVYFMREVGKLSIQMTVSPEAPKGNVDQIIPKYISMAMPNWFVYIFMLTLLSAAMSTLSSQFHTMGSALARDFYEGWLEKGSARGTVFITRLGIVITILISVVLAYRLPPNIIARGTAIFFGLCASSFLPMYTFALFWRRVTRAGAIAGMLSGLALTIFWLVFIHAKEASAFGICRAIFGRDFLISSHPWPVVDPIVVALPISTAVTALVSLVRGSQESGS